MKSEKSRTWAEIDLSAYRYNFNIGKKQVKDRKIMCVIKGDAHGHGAVMAAKTLVSEGAYGFGLACLEEGIDLRENGINSPILILGWTDIEETDTLAKYDISQSVMSYDYAKALSDEALRLGVTVNVHAKVDTGMSRTGIMAQEDPESAAEEIMKIDKLPGIKIVGIFTHYAAADMPEKDDFTRWQLNNYKAVLDKLKELGFDKEVIHHTGNSASIMYHDDTYFDMVRMGEMVYGLSPTGEDDPEFDLKPVLTLKTRVAQVKELPVGAHISYGCTAVAEKPMKIAVVTAGYADSYPRSLSNKGAYAVINGQKARQIGRICMDMCMFDVTGLSVKAGDEVILYGGQGGMSLNEVAKLTGSINCEPTCTLTKRIHKIYIND